MAEAPYYGTYTRLGVRVSASAREVIRAGRRKLAPTGKTRAQREARHEFLRAMLAHHESARDLVRRYRL